MSKYIYNKKEFDKLSQPEKDRPCKKISADFLVHYPGRPLYLCDKHAKQSKQFSIKMGVDIVMQKLSCDHDFYCESNECLKQKNPDCKHENLKGCAEANLLYCPNCETEISR